MIEFITIFTVDKLEIKWQVWNHVKQRMDDETFSSLIF